MMDELYIVGDIEATGPIPGKHSMLSLGAVAIERDGTEIGAYSQNLKELPGGVWDDRTLAFWAKNPAALAEATKDPQDPEEAIKLFSYWLKSFDRPVVFVGMPAGFDFTYVYWYLHMFMGESPLSFSAIDMKTFGMVLTNSTYKGSIKRNWPRTWFPPNHNHTHKAIEDAREQAYELAQMFKALDALHAMKQHVLSQ